MIRRGSKLHRVTFKDEVTFTQEGAEEPFEQEGSKHRISKRGSLNEIILVESYKEYNGSEMGWY